MCAAGKIRSRIEIRLCELNGKLKSCYTVLRKNGIKRVNSSSIAKTKKNENSCNIGDSKVRASVGKEKSSDRLVNLNPNAGCACDLNRLGMGQNVPGTVVKVSSSLGEKF